MKKTLIEYLTVAGYSEVEFIGERFRIFEGKNNYILYDKLKNTIYTAYQSFKVHENKQSNITEGK